MLVRAAGGDGVGVGACGSGSWHGGLVSVVGVDGVGVLAVTAAGKVVLVRAAGEGSMLSRAAAWGSGVLGSAESGAAAITETTGSMAWF